MMLGKNNKCQTQRIIVLLDSIKRHINTIQSLVGVTQADFRSLYVTTIENITAYLTEPNQPLNEASITGILEQAVLVLKKRQGYLLPMGADSEIIFREREEWTFALFSASLLNILDEKIRFILAKALVPQEAYSWLHRNPTLFGLWKDYLQGNIHANILADIINPHPISSKIIAAPDSRLPDTQEAAEREKAPIVAQVIQHKQEAQLFEPCTIEGVSVSSQPPEIKAISLVALQGENKPKVQEKPLIELIEQPPIATAQEFWDWLKPLIENNTLSVNQNDSVLHGVELGILIQIPEAIELFLTHYASLYKLTGNSIAEQQTDFTRTLKKSEKLLRNSQGSRIHIYCVDRWEQRLLISGIVADLNSLAIAKDKVPINPRLTPDPLAGV
ncbi:MAG: helicase/relaxase domain-containing protein [Gammaproteobacteria bacterium]|nr:helicase/relaxase domain-containing protein [Gammaproteobacteria bacterium]MBY0544822.1 helicase/relaxase domain-containing protein [Gammaproteobacteria bacterium]